MPMLLPPLPCACACDAAGLLYSPPVAASRLIAPHRVALLLTPLRRLCISRCLCCAAGQRIAAGYSHCHQQQAARDHQLDCVE